MATRTSSPLPAWSIPRGILEIEGKPALLRAAAYPFYRDDARNWAARLSDIKSAGFNTVTSYVPWRHHEVAPDRFDFEGSTHPARNLVRFLDEADEVGLRVLLKPGPFVHAELPFGGLPDKVCANCNPDAGIEPERDAYGSPVRWALRGMVDKEAHVLPSPWCPVFDSMSRRWLEAVGSVLRGRSGPNGTVFALQLMNEGIYGESSHSSPDGFGFSRAALTRYRAWLAAKQGGDGEVPSDGNPSEAEPPRKVSLLRSVEDVAPYLRWSEYQSTLYHSLARSYRDAIVRGGAHPDISIVFNFNPNGSTYRDQPGTNDGWYTRVYTERSRGFSMGTTNWIGVLCQDDASFRQYVMALTSICGPAMELNWGFGTEYFAPFDFVTPTAFETLLALACGATGFTAYTFCGTRHWRNDPNLNGQWMPPRTNARTDETQFDYPGAPAVYSNGDRSPKFATAVQFNQLCADEGERWISKEFERPLAWGVYAPYAWTGQWLWRGDPDDVLWRPPLEIVPRAVFHGLDAFTEMLLDRGTCPRQIDLTDPLEEWPDVRAMAVSLHEFMDEETQARLVEWVRRGGCLFATGIVPSRGLDLAKTAGRLGELFPHEAQKVELDVPSHFMWGDVEGVALDALWRLRIPPDAKATAESEHGIVGYIRPVGRGRVGFLGVPLWRAALSQDDPETATSNQAVVWAALEEIAGLENLPVQAARSAIAFPTVNGLFLVTRHRGGTVACRWRRVPRLDETGEVHPGRHPLAPADGDGELDIEVESPSEAVHYVAWDDEGIRAAFLKGTNDIRGERTPPSVRVGISILRADAACDLCFSTRPEGWRVSVAHAKESVAVHLPSWINPLRALDAHGQAIPLRRHDGHTIVEVPPVETAGIVRLVAHEGSQGRAEQTTAGMAGAGDATG